MIESNHGEPTDVVLLGDDLVERWVGQIYGTLHSQLIPNKKVFDSYFSPSPLMTTSSVDRNEKASGGDDNDSLDNITAVSGLALGIANDECPNLLYQVQNGLMDHIPSRENDSSDLSTSIWWIIIGNNDVVSKGNKQCSYEGILAGIVKITSDILFHRPQATIVINSIIPTAPLLEQSSSKPHSTSSAFCSWSHVIQPLNEALECYAAGQYDRVEFVNVTNLFLDATPPLENDEFNEDAENKDSDNNAVGVNQSLFHVVGDRMYINPFGYELWGQVIVDKVRELSENRRERRP
ncbi:hypothetical protein ACA910_006718 [Epithemia clementina (nom. ined.)]